jgi:lipopolysaccharide/colanic/teichoic acid biosynthesis glycosyltransferase
MHKSRVAALRVKRLIDLIVTLPVAIALLPMMAAVGMLVWMTMGRPVIFRQLRPGRNGRLFRIIKFRSMRDVRDADGCLLPDAERLTSLGRFLRRLSLDELPQLWNVVRGDMGLVGPRPLLREYLPRYSESQRRRHAVRPGITGWAQVNGRNAIGWSEKLALDVWYVEHWSLLLDMKILALTLQNVILREGISSGDHATMPEFMGDGKARS